MVWWLGGTLILVGLLLRFWLGDHLFLTRYMAYLMPWLLLGLLPGAVWAGFVQHRGLAILLGGAAMVILVVYAPLFWPSASAADKRGDALKVLSYNTWSKNHEIDRIARVIKNQKPDILLLQELNYTVFEKLMGCLEDLYSGQEVHFTYVPRMLLAVVSRYPVETASGLEEKGRVQRVVLRSPVGPIAVFNVHMLRRGGWFFRYQKITQLFEGDLVYEKGPVILGGDFNAPDQSETYQYIDGFLDNAHWKAGFGFGFSFPTPSRKIFDFVPLRPLVRIDHIFINDCFSVLQAGTVKDSGGSDHFPVMAVLGFK